ncbi:MAG: hypothetical protein AAF570_29300, partial [Bacteroidota bacterium]
MPPRIQFRISDEHTEISDEHTEKTEYMSANRLFILNLCWASLAVGTYFIGRNSGDGNGPKLAGSTEPTNARPLPALRNEAPDQGSSNSKNESGRWENVPLEEATGLFQALREARVREEERLSAFSRTVTRENALAMLKVFEETPRDEMTDRLFVKFLQAWGKVAGPEKISFVMDSFKKVRMGSRWRVGCDGDTNNDTCVTSFMAGWASVDLAAAMEFTSKLHAEGQTRDSTRTHLGVLRALENSNLDAAIAYSQQSFAETAEFWSRKPYSAYEEDKFEGLGRVLAAVEQQR